MREKDEQGKRSLFRKQILYNKDALSLGHLENWFRLDNESFNSAEEKEKSIV